MAGDDVDAKKDEQLQDMRTQIDGLDANIKMMHERMDSTVTTENERFDQPDLAQTTTKTTLDTIMSHLNALNTMVTDFQQDYGGDTEQDGGHRQGRARRVPRHHGNDPFAKIKFKIPSFNGKYGPTAYLDWELEVEMP